MRNTTTSNVMRISENRKIEVSSASSTLLLRPVIEMSYSDISVETANNKVSVTFNANGGIFNNNELTNQITSVENSTIVVNGEYMIPSKANYFFDGWYTDTTYNTKVTL